MVISGIKISNEIIFSPVLASCYHLPRQLVRFLFQLQAHPAVAYSHFECHERKTLKMKNAYQTVTTYLLVFPTTLLRAMEWSSLKTLSSSPFYSAFQKFSHFEYFYILQRETACWSNFHYHPSGAHRYEPAAPLCPYDGVFTDQFIFRSIFP